MDKELLKSLIKERFGNVRGYSKSSGIDESTLCYLLQGKRDPGYRLLRKLVKTLGLTEAQVVAVFFADVVAELQHTVETT